MSVASCHHSRPRLACALLLAAACSSAPAPPARSAQPKSPRPKQEPAAAQSKPEPAAESPEAWNALVDQGEVWARPELDRFCDAGGRAYFVHTRPATTYDQPEGPALFGCQPRFNGTVVEVGRAEPPCGARGVSGQTYCCPSQLRSPPPPISAGGRTCEQAQLEYLTEVGIDPLVVPVDSGRANAPSFDRHAKVVGRGSYLDACHVDPSALIEVCAAVRNGVAVGITVCIQPSDPEAGECIARAVQNLDYTKSERLDVTETTFEPKKK